MDYPQLSHLQALVLDCLGAGVLSGRALRERMAEAGVRKSGPAFYQAMARLEEAGFVKGSYTQKIVEAQIIKEREYELTGEGERALRDTVAFYASLGAGRLGGGAYA
jgi:DNA-binding PadR family transcriptional regulator